MTKLWLDFDREHWTQLADPDLIGGSAGLDALIRDPKFAQLLEKLPAGELAEAYIPLLSVVNSHYQGYLVTHRARQELLGAHAGLPPFVIGVAGSVSVGKSTTAALLQVLLQAALPKASVALVATDGFLYPNSKLSELDILERKGFPESYDYAKLLDFLADAKDQQAFLQVPHYSHEIYDILPHTEQLASPDILIVEGLNILQPSPQADATGAQLSDFCDFTIYVDADYADIRDWFRVRFMALRQAAFEDETSFFRSFTELTETEALALSDQVWDTINGPNLVAHIAPTRQRADLILTKAADHRVIKVRVRNQ